MAGGIRKVYYPVKRVHARLRKPRRRYTIGSEALVKNQLRIVLLGCGTIGSQVAKRITDMRQLWRTRLGLDITLVGIVVRNVERERPGIARELLTDEAEKLITAQDTDVVIELLGGKSPAREYIELALRSGKPVVTANKELLSLVGSELMTLAAQNSVPLYCEAAVGGAIPLMRVFEESLLGDEILSFKGILNGTTNYILDQMEQGGQTFQSALTQAQQLGYAESDPTADIEGWDSAAKAAILATSAFYAKTTRDQVACQGITGVTARDVAAASSFDLSIKLVASGSKCSVQDSETGFSGVNATNLWVEVAPVAFPKTHPLAKISGATNALYIETRLADTLMLTGPGAGPDPTTSAVLGDMISALLWSRTPSGSGCKVITGTANLLPNTMEASHLVVAPAGMTKIELRDLLRASGFEVDRLFETNLESGVVVAALTLPTVTTKITQALVAHGDQSIHVYRIEE